MAKLEVKNLSMSYDGKNKILEDLSLSIQDGELVSILGPSGCGKTTTLRIIAGLLKQTDGEIIVGEKNISNLPVHKREFGMVFQSYALFPHLSVFNNVAFGLKMRKLDKKQIQEKVENVLSVTGLSDLAKRFPAELSGGQQQRVSLARALVINPQVLLLDEPLSNLDAKLRVEMREEIRRLQQELKMTAIFVTHDQEECFAISDKVAVMNRGRVEQFDTPQAIYQEPKTLFVAKFIGFENFIKVVGYDGEAYLTESNIKLVAQAKENTRYLTIRPRQIKIIETANDSENVVKGRIINRTYLGNSYRYTVKTSLGVLKVDDFEHDVLSRDEDVILELAVKNLLPLEN